MVDGFPRILVLKPSSLGDVVHTLPAVSAIRKHWPESEISWLINPEWATLLDGNLEVDRVIEFPRRSFRGIRGLLKVPAWLKKIEIAQPDLALDFQGLLRTALIARYVGARKIVGLSDAREGAALFYDQKVTLPRQPMHAVDRYLKLAGAVGALLPKLPFFRLPAGSRPQSEIPPRFVLLHPFSRGDGKSLEEAAVVRLCKELQPHCVLLVGGGRKLENAPENAVDLFGKTTLAELIWLIRNADFTISVDSGPMHIASALTDQLLSIHTWSDPLLVGPYNGNAWISKNNVIQKMADYQAGSSEKKAVPDAAKIGLFVRTQVGSLAQ